MADFETIIFLERPDKPRMIVRKYHFSIPDKEFEGLRKRDWFVYGRVRPEELSAAEAEARRIEESQNGTYRLPTIAEAERQYKLDKEQWDESEGIKR